MNIKIENLGAIKDAEINLNKRLTIFCGPNNSGKTYMAFMIYALTKSGFKIHKRGNRMLAQDLVKSRFAKYDLNINDIWEYRQNEISSLIKSLDSIYGISTDIVNNLFSDFNISILESKEEFIANTKKMNFENTINLKDTIITIKKQENSDYIELSINEDDSVSKQNIEFLELFLETKLYSLIAFYPFTSSYILPVERNSIYTFSKELSIKKQDFFDRAQEIGSNAKSDPFQWFLKRSTRYPLPIRDGLETAEDLGEYNKIKTEYYSFAEEIEEELLSGKVNVSKDGEVQFSSNKAKRKKIPIHLTASIVKTLSSLVFYLKHRASKNDLIIIDEPELNLHPNNQIILTRIFAKLINKGFRLLISTHSDYIIREINNLIMISSPNDGVSELATKLGYTDDEKINLNQIGAYLFDYNTSRARKISVRPIVVTENGFDVSTIDKTIEVLNNTSEELFYTIKYGVEEDE